jgi:hypothetical protein
MRHRLTIILGLALALAMATGALAGTVSETFVEGGGGNQFAGDGNTTYLTWSSNTTAHPQHYDALFRLLAGGSSSKMNAAGTQGFAGDINGITNEAVYQQTDGSSSDLYLYNLATETRAAAPDAVNSILWEWAPSVSDGYILYGRNKFTRKSSPWKVMLYDRNADTNIVLDTVTRACACIYPGQVSDDYATWTRCSKSTCQAWYYDIAGETTAKIPNPNDKLQYFPAVSAATGDLYFVQSAFGCGLHTKIMEWNPVAGGAANLVSTQPRGYDVYAGPKVFDDGTHQDVYVDRQVCSGKYYADIYVINDADTAFSRVVGHPSAGTSAPKQLHVPGATPRG